MDIGNKQFFCLLFIQLATSIGLWSIMLHYGKANSKPNQNINHNHSNKECQEREVLRSPFISLSSQKMSEFLLKIPIDAQQLSEVNIYEESKVICKVPGSEICSLRSRIINCSPNCFDNSIACLNVIETRKFSNILKGMVKCDQ